MSKPLALISLLTTLLALACSDDGKGEESAAPADGKFDTFWAPTVEGEAMLGEVYAATFTDESQFFAWDIDLPNYTVVNAFTDVIEGGEELDTVMYVYERNEDGSFGSYIHRGDDGVASYLARLDGLHLEAGSYRFLIKAYDHDTRGEFAFGIACVDGCADAPNYTCSFGVEESALPYDYTDGYRATPAELLGRLTSANWEENESSELVVLAEQAAEHEGYGSVGAYLGTVDEGALEIYSLTWASTEYEWIRAYRGDTEFGYLYEAGYAETVAEISDGAIMGCEDGECSSAVEHIFPGTSDALLGEAAAFHVVTLSRNEAPNELQLDQIRVMLTQIGFFSCADAQVAGFNELRDVSDEGSFEYYNAGTDFDWIAFYAGDTEVGAFFNHGTTELIGTVGDGEVSACTPVR
ncbi:MAG: hypothetical protein AAF411_15280 [Myxococcota bacterium]